MSEGVPAHASFFFYHFIGEVLDGLLLMIMCGF
jgi:hypothetical protein